MTTAEFKTLREAVGITCQWVADRIDVTQRQVARMESGECAVSARAAQLVVELDTLISRSVDAALAVAGEWSPTEEGDDLRVTLLRYHSDDELWWHRSDCATAKIPVGVHNTILARTWSALRARSIPVGIVYMNEGDYTAWLGDRDNNESARAEWAANQCSNRL